MKVRKLCSRGSAEQPGETIILHRLGDLSTALLAVLNLVPTWTRLQLIAIRRPLENQGAPSPPENVVRRHPRPSAPPSVGPPQPATPTPVEAAMRTLQAVICSGTPVAAKRRKKNKVAAVAQAAGAVRRDGSVEEKVKKKKKTKKKKKEKKSAVGGLDLVCLPVAVAVVAAKVAAAKVAAIVDPDPPWT
eukprot:scaffold37085_cov57-Phaeocystis_antarctica.AAC.2